MVRALLRADLAAGVARDLTLGPDRGNRSTRREPQSDETRRRGDPPGSCFSGSVIRLFEIVLVDRSSRMFISIGINTSMCKARFGGVVHHNYSTI
jgi:hypothetical protein